MTSPSFTIYYLTSGKQETRAWTIKEGTKAPQAAGKIHSDFERGFIRNKRRQGMIPKEALWKTSALNERCGDAPRI